MYTRRRRDSKENKFKKSELLIRQSDIHVTRNALFNAPLTLTTTTWKYYNDAYIGIHRKPETRRYDAG